jgi:Fur family ferric uptake transcriptional regulator
MDVLDLFSKTTHALSTKDLEEELGDYDRVTLYRTLNSFIEQGVIHRIPDDSGVARYGMCHDTCLPHDHHHDHVHFKCDDCGQMECLSSYKVPRVEVPGYEIHDANLILTGLCKACRNN